MKLGSHLHGLILTLASLKTLSVSTVTFRGTGGDGALTYTEQQITIIMGPLLPG